ncbi:hypothetical protein Bbelb_422380 [Branchiostoma belcheri]|nr:hypothetical protein Bbelb_422380 [Branchiostoma belcheri]
MECASGSIEDTIREYVGIRTHISAMECASGSIEDTIRGYVGIRTHISAKECASGSIEDTVRGYVGIRTHIPAKECASGSIEDTYPSGYEDASAKDLVSVRICSYPSRDTFDGYRGICQDPDRSKFDSEVHDGKECHECIGRWL